MSADHRLIIGSERVDLSTKLPVSNPFNGEKLAEAPLGDEATLDRAVEVARQAFEKTRGQPAFERANLLNAIAKGIESRKAEFVDSIVAEAAKPISLAEGEVARAIVTFTAAAEEARRIAGEVLPLDGFAPGTGHLGISRRCPLGVIYGISPFNFPLNLVAHKVAPCIASGNAMVLKPSPRTPLTAILLGELLLDCGMIPGQINIVTCPNDLAGRLVEDDRVKMVSFTGSPAVGWPLKARAGKKRVALELGGNAGVIVHEDAGLNAAIPMIAAGAFAYAGQSCISVQRIFVHRPICQAFADQFAAHVREKIISGDPRDRAVLVGPMITADAAQRALRSIASAVRAGAKTLTGGKGAGSFVEPTTLTDVLPEMEVCRTEIFAPVATISVYDDFAEALRQVNDSPFGLQAGVFTRDLNRTIQAFNELEVGAVMINQVPTWRADDMPYGGVKDSGFGREGPRFAIEEMMELRMMVVRI